MVKSRTKFSGATEPTAVKVPLLSIISRISLWIRPGDRSTSGVTPILEKTGSGIFATGQGRFGGAWVLNRETCQYEFKSFIGSAGIRIRSRVPIPNLSFKLGPVANVAVGIQIDGIFGGSFKLK